MSSQEQQRAPRGSAHLFEHDWEVPWHAHSIPLLLTVLMVGIWASGQPHAHPETWLLSWARIARGQIVPFVAYMFAHLNLMHLAMNALGLLILGGPLVACFGRPPVAWARFLYLFIGAGVCGGLAFVLTHQNPSPVLGASGAIFGVLGALARVHPATGGLAPIASQRTWLVTKFFVGNHVALFVLAALVAVVTGQVQSLAWEAHLGGLLFGFLAAPLFLDKTPLAES